MDTADQGVAADIGATPGISAQPSSASERAAVTILQRIADVTQQHGWNPLTSRLSDFIEAQLAELDRYRVAAAERDATQRENAVTAKQRDTNEG